MQESEIHDGMQVSFLADGVEKRGMILEGDVYQPGDVPVLVVDVLVEAEDTVYPVELDDLKAV